MAALNPIRFKRRAMGHLSVGDPPKALIKVKEKKKNAF
jgi:hypothetical protein